MHLNRFSRFSTDHGYVEQRNSQTHTDHRTSVTIGRIFVIMRVRVESLQNLFGRRQRARERLRQLSGRRNDDWNSTMNSTLSSSSLVPGITTRHHAAAATAPLNLQHISKSVRRSFSLPSDCRGPSTPASLLWTSAAAKNRSATSTTVLPLT